MPKYEIRITEGALGDLDAIRSFIAVHRGEDSADEWMAGLHDIIDSLEQFPERGSVPPPLLALGIDTYRQLPMLPFRIVYEVGDTKAFVVSIALTKRNFQSLLQERMLRP
jgi:toxin ParE1/3/4